MTPLSWAGTQPARDNLQGVLFGCVWRQDHIGEQELNEDTARAVGTARRGQGAGRGPALSPRERTAFEGTAKTRASEEQGRRVHSGARGP